MKKCRVIFLAAYMEETRIILNYLWKKGVRPGDITFIGEEWVRNEFWSGPKPPEITPGERSITWGTLRVLASAWAGEYGQQMKELYFKKFGVYSSDGGYAMDGIFMAAHAIRNLID